MTSCWRLTNGWQVMATLSSDQLTDVQGDLGISDDEGVFTDTELNRLYTRAGGDYEKTVAFAYRQLWANALKFTRYTQGRSSEDKTAIRDALKDAMMYWEQKAGISGGTLSFGVIDTGLDQEDTTS